MGTTIYLNDEIAKLAKEVSNRSGKGVSQLFREFLIRTRSTLGGVERLAFVVSDKDLKEEIGQDANDRPLSLRPSISDDPYRFDKWVSLDSTESVFLMGTTMKRAVVSHLPMWKKFLEAGKHLRILLQGEIDEAGEISVYTPVKNEIKSVHERRALSLKALHDLSRSCPEQSLEVRNSGSSLISYSAVLVFKLNGQVDIQIQPYTFQCHQNVTRGARFIVSTQYGSDIYHLLADPIEDMWEHSLPELRS